MPPIEETPGPKILRRRRCDNCNRLYRPTKEDQRFCRDAVKGKPNFCRYEFHKHGSAFGPLKTRLEKLCLQTIKGEVAKIRAELASMKNRLDELAEDILTK